MVRVSVSANLMVSVSLSANLMLRVCLSAKHVCLSVSNLKVRVSVPANLLVSVFLQTFWCQSVSKPDGESQSAKLMVSVCLS